MSRRYGERSPQDDRRRKASGQRFSKHDRDDRDRDHDNKRRRLDDDDKHRRRRRSRSRSPSDHRKDKRKSRSRSARNQRRDKDRSRQRDRRKKTYRYDSPPRNQNTNAEENQEEMVKLNQMKAKQELVSSKADRKLYLGNLPPNITTSQLMELLNSALRKLNINTDVEGDSIVSAWISPDGVGHYAFIEFRTAQEATSGMALNNAFLFGCQLKFGRPKQYLQYNKQLMTDVGNDGDMDGILKQVSAVALEEDIKVLERIICPPSRILMLKHMVTLEELGIDEEYQQIVEDVNDMAHRFGRVLSIVIPRYQFLRQRPHPLSEEMTSLVERVKGLGYVFVEYDTVQVARAARKQFTCKMFSQRSIACGYIDEDRYSKRELQVDQRVIIDF